MQQIFLNEQPYQTQADNLAQLAAELQLSANGGAAICQGDVIPAGLWADTPVSAGAQISFFQLVAGG